MQIYVHVACDNSDEGVAMFVIFECVNYRDYPLKGQPPAEKKSKQLNNSGEPSPYHCVWYHVLWVCVYMYICVYACVCCVHVCSITKYGST